MEPLRVGLVGAGYWGLRNGAEFVDFEGTTLAAIADVDPETLEETGDELGVPPDSRYEDLESMLETASLDALVVATPPAFHKEHVLSALERELHVFCEKPLCVSVDSGRQIVDAARNSESIVRMGFQRRIEPFSRAGKEALDGDSIECFSVEVVDDWRDVFEGTWRMNPDASGGGVTFDTGTHFVDAIAWLTGLEPVSVTASMDFVDDEQKIDLRSAITMELENGVVGTLSIMGDTPRAREHVHVWSDRCGVYLSSKEWSDRSMKIIDSDGTERVPHIQQDGPSKAAAFHSAIRGDKSGDQLATAGEGLRALATLRAIYQAARTGETVPVEQVWLDDT